MSQELELLPAAGLHEEIIEVYEQLGERPAHELLAGLNTPGRIQRRGFPATTEHLLAIIIDTWRVDENTRFVVYDTELSAVNRKVYKDGYQAADAAKLCGSTHTVKRFQT